MQGVVGGPTIPVCPYFEFCVGGWEIQILEFAKVLSNLGETDRRTFITLGTSIWVSGILNMIAWDITQKCFEIDG